MDLSLRERFARLGPVRGVDRVTSGSPAAFLLRSPTALSALRSIDAMHVLARRGVSMLKAKRCIEAMIEVGKATIELPTVEDREAVLAELAAAGVEVSLLGASRA